MVNDVAAIGLLAVVGFVGPIPCCARCRACVRPLESRAAASAAPLGSQGRFDSIEIAAALRARRPAEFVGWAVVVVRTAGIDIALGRIVLAPVSVFHRRVDAFGYGLAAQSTHQRAGDKADNGADRSRQRAGGCACEGAAGGAEPGSDRVGTRCSGNWIAIRLTIAELSVISRHTVSCDASCEAGWPSCEGRRLLFTKRITAVVIATVTSA